MNKKQKTVIVIAWLVFVLSLFNAPWTTKSSTNTVHKVSSPIWDPPMWTPHLQTGTMTMQWIALGLISGSLIVAFKSK